MILDIFLFPWVLLITQICISVLLICLIVLNYREIKVFLLQHFEKRDIKILFSILLFACLVRVRNFTGIPYTNDEYMYIQSARELAHQYEPTGYSRVIGWPFLLSGVFSLFWYKILSGTLTTLLFSIGTIALLYILIKLILNKRKIAVFSSLLFAILPSHIFWSDKLETNTPSLFFILLSLLVYYIFDTNKHIKTFLLCIILTVFTTTFRGENIVLYLPLLLLALLNIQVFIKRPKYFIWSFITSVSWALLVLSNYVHQYVFTASQSWSYGTTENISPKNFFENIQIFFAGFFDNGLFITYDIFACIGLGYMMHYLYKKGWWRWVFLFSAIFLGLLIMYTLIWLKFVFGVERLYMEVYPLYSLFFGAGVYTLFLSFKFYFKKYSRVIGVFCVLLCMGNLICTSSYSQKYSPHRLLQMKMSQDIATIQQKECIYIVYKPFYYQGFVDNFTYVYLTEFLLNSSLQERVLNSFSCVIFADDKFCNDDSPGNKFFWLNHTSSKEYCDMMKANFRLIEQKKYKQDGEVYGWWKVEQKQ